MKVGIAPRRSSSVCSLTAALVERNGAHGNIDRHRSMVVESERIDGVGQLHAEGLAGVERSAPCDQSLSELDSRCASRAPSLASASVERATGADESPCDRACPLGPPGSLDVAQALAVGELREGHDSGTARHSSACARPIAPVARHDAVEASSTAGTPSPVRTASCRDTCARSGPWRTRFRPDGGQRSGVMADSIPI